MFSPMEIFLLIFLASCMNLLLCDRQALPERAEAAYDVSRVKCTKTSTKKPCKIERFYCKSYTSCAYTSCIWRNHKGKGYEQWSSNAFDFPQIIISITSESEVILFIGSLKIIKSTDNTCILYIWNGFFLLSRNCETVLIKCNEVTSKNNYNLRKEN